MGQGERQILVTGGLRWVRCRGNALPDLDAIVLADQPVARHRIAGLSIRERAVRVARRVGARRVHVIESAADRSTLVAWRGPSTHPVLVIRADQLVHTPLVQPLIGSLPSDGIAMAVVPDVPDVEDLPAGSYAGAFVATGTAANAVVASIAAGENDGSLVAAALPIAHGAVARAPVATDEQRRTAHRLLYSTLVKAQDNAITRYLYRPVSFPLTRLLVWTPITPNQVSYIVAALVALGCWLTAHGSMSAALAGTVVVLVASYVDCCDGEIARVKLLSSRFGAWLDTIVDELASVGYMVALGWHCRLHYGPLRLASGDADLWCMAVAVGVVTYAWSIYCVYYNIIVAVGSANSQDYAARFELCPGASPNSVRLVPSSSSAKARTRKLPGWVEWLATYAPYVVRRDFISWVTVALAALHLTRVSFAGLVLGGMATAAILAIDHLRLRGLRRDALRRGFTIDRP